MEKTIAFIFARGGSKGLPRKNIRLLAGKPLIAYSIETALECRAIDRVIVSTEDEEIAEIAKSFGAEVPFLRPEELAQDRSSEWLAWQHAVSYILDDCDRQGVQFVRFVSLPATSPLRSVTDVERCIEALDEETDMVVTAKPAERNPYFNMLVTNENGYCQRVLEPDTLIEHRQATPEVFDMTTVAYVARPEFILGAQGVFDGRVKAVLIPKRRAVDIDDIYDFVTAEALMSLPD